MSWERLWATQSRWLRVDQTTHAAEKVNHAFSEALPPHWWQNRSFWDVFSRLYPEERDRLIFLAERTLDGRFLLFQWKETNRPKPVNWSSTIESETSSAVWPDRYYSEIAVSHDPEKPDRDVKWCWELNRFQHLLWLGASWRLTDQDRFAAAAREHLESWFDSVRYPCGVQWTSNLEVALRGLSFTWCHALCLNSPAWNEEFLSRFIPCLYLHGLHLEKELTVHHTEGNHLLGESSALYCISTLYPLFSDASRWRERSIKILNRLVPRVVLPDGVYAEQSTGYFHFIAEFLFQVLLLNRGRGLQLSDAVRERLANGLCFIKNLAPDARDVPMIGDSDTGSALGWRLSDFWDFTPLLATGSVLLGEPGLLKGVPSFPAESFLMLGEDGLQAFESEKNSALADGKASAPSPLLVFPDGGYHVSRDERFSVTFDAGPLGIAPAYGHGHADGLSFILHYHGKPVIVDPGTFVYNGPPVWRNYFRSSSAHNTVRIDNKDPVDPIETFRWSGPVKIQQGEPTQGEDWRILHAAVHWKRIVHRRYLIHLINQGVIILDRISGVGEHDLEWRFHFDPRWMVREDPGGTSLHKKVPPAPPSKNSIRCSECGLPHTDQDVEVFGEESRKGLSHLRGTRSSPPLPVLPRHSSENGNPDFPCQSFAAQFGADRLDISFLSLSPFDTSILEGSMDPMAGWYSRYYGSKAPSPTLMAQMKVQLPATLLAAVKPADEKLTLPRGIPENLLGSDVSDLLHFVS